MRRRLDWAAEAAGGRLLAGEPSAELDGAALDSRAVEPGNLFFALRGEENDGHEYLPDAARRGAAVAAVHLDPPDLPELPEDAPMALLRVEDTYAALHDLARAARREIPERLVAITGSAGKTTTKDLLTALLGRRFRVAKNPGNFNNLYGYPVSLLNIPDDTEWMVAEMGMSSPGELGQVSRLGLPDVAVFTNVRAVHLEFFPDVDGIAEAKAELLEGVSADGLVVANADDPRVMRIAGRHRERGGRVVTYGVESAEAAYRAEEIRPGLGDYPGSHFRLVTPSATAEIGLSLLGRHNVENFLAAAAAALEIGVPLDQVAAAAGEVRPTEQRGVLHRLAPAGKAGKAGEGDAEIVVVDDSYNSNPSALERVLETYAEIPPPGEGGRRWAVLGDMLELGPEEERFHREAGERAAELGFAPIVGVGELARALSEAAEAAAAGGRAAGESRWFASATEAADFVAAEVEPGDLVLVKGSRGVGLDTIVCGLRDRFGDPEGGADRGEGDS